MIYARQNLWYNTNDDLILMRVWHGVPYVSTYQPHSHVPIPTTNAALNRTPTCRVHLPVVLLCDVCDNLEGLGKTVCISDPVMPLLLADATVDRFVMSTVDAVTVPFARPVIPLT